MVSPEQEQKKLWNSGEMKIYIIWKSKVEVRTNNKNESVFESLSTEIEETFTTDI